MEVLAIRKSLQSKGTPFAKGKLQRVNDRKRRFMTDENHKLAKWICNIPYNCIVLENVRGLKSHRKSKKKASQTLCRKFGNWSYYQLEQFIIQRAEKVGKTVLFVNSQYTSQ